VPAQFSLRFSDEAEAALGQLASSPQYAKKLKKVRNALGRLQVDPRHPGLRSHKYSSLHGQNGEDVWDSYVENNTPSAWRIFWHYGPGVSVITVISIAAHP
jgi:hypothetical protein